MAARATEYKGVVYRSKTEARWAVFFDLARIKVEYEEESYMLPSGGYLPDFWIPELDCFFEVKGSYPEDFTKQEELHQATGKPVVVAIGPPGSKLGTSYGPMREPMSVYHTIGSFNGRPATEFVQFCALEWTISKRFHEFDDEDWGHISKIVGMAASYQFPRWNAPVVESSYSKATTTRPGDAGFFHDKFGLGIASSYSKDEYGREIVYATFPQGDGTTTPSPLLSSHVTFVDRRFKGWTKGAPERKLCARIINPKQYHTSYDGVWRMNGNEPKFFCLECEEVLALGFAVDRKEDLEGWSIKVNQYEIVTKYYGGQPYNMNELWTSNEYKISFYCQMCKYRLDGNEG